MERTVVRDHRRTEQIRGDADDTPTGETPIRDGRSAERPIRRLVVLAGAAVLVLVAVIGYALTRPTTWHRSGPPATVSAWAPYWQTDSALASFTANRNVFSNLSLFAYHATAADSITAFDGLGSGVLETYRSAARAAGVALTASIIDDMPANGMAAVLADPTSRATHVATIVSFAAANGFDGIDLDYEKFAFSDGRATWDSTRPNWVAFVTDLAKALHAAGRTLTVSAPPSGDYSVYDYEAIGKVVDGIRIMAYDYSTSDPGPIAPIAWVKDIVASAKKLVPADKLVLGVPVYGYDWPAQITGTCPGAEADQPHRSNVSAKTAATLAASKGIEPTWIPAVEERTFNYTEQLTGVDTAGAATACTVSHTVWYSDAQSVHDRAYLAEHEDLAGVAVWALGSDDDLVWAGIEAARANVEVWPPVVAGSGVAGASTAVTG
ncbi:MAG: putative glycosidase [Ilumatobacteraceae bacterium]|nr:putative glycosidase [Ilumatobacteraceae bacterium]